MKKHYGAASLQPALGAAPSAANDVAGGRQPTSLLNNEANIRLWHVDVLMSLSATFSLCLQLVDHSQTAEMKTGLCRGVSSLVFLWLGSGSGGGG